MKKLTNSTATPPTQRFFCIALTQNQSKERHCQHLFGEGIIEVQTTPRPYPPRTHPERHTLQIYGYTHGYSSIDYTATNT